MHWSRVNDSDHEPVWMARVERENHKQRVLDVWPPRAALAPAPTRAAAQHFVSQIVIEPSRRRAAPSGQPLELWAISGKWSGTAIHIMSAIEIIPRPIEISHPRHDIYEKPSGIDP